MRRRFLAFSLVELLIGMFIFTISMLGIVSVYPTAMRAIQKGRDLMLAQMLAEQQMQAMLATAFASQASYSGQDMVLKTTVNGVQQVKTFTVTTTVYSVATNGTVTALAVHNPPITNTTTNLNDIVVNVTWADPSHPKEHPGSITYESQSHQ